MPALPVSLTASAPAPLAALERGRGAVTAPPTLGSPPRSFAAVVGELARSIGAEHGETLTAIGRLLNRTQRGAPISPAELLAVQMRVGEMGLRVEVVSKAADGVLSTVRRLQSGQ